MVDFSYATAKPYIQLNDSEWIFGAVGAGTLQDLDNDNRFESGDTLTMPSGNPGEYFGVVTFDGELCPVFLVSSGVPTPIYWVFAPAGVTLTGANPNPIAEGAEFLFCFGAGTGIATPRGDQAVETLEIGDPILTAEGRTVPVKWIGRQTVLPAFTNARLDPIRIEAGALGDGLPKRDLLVTADHGMILDGLVVNAGALVNGHSIRRLSPSALPQQVTYYHIETEAHDVILAEGAPAETFIDYAARKSFDNHAEYEALYGAERLLPEMPLPRASSARLLPPALRARLEIGDVAQVA